MVSKLNILCFSKDRPLQLRAYIESLSIHCEVKYELYVLVKITSEAYRGAYSKLNEEYDFTLIEEDHNGQTFISVLDAFLQKSKKYVMFGCDDTIFVNKINLDFAMKEVNNLCFSYRMSPNTSYCHPAHNSQVFNGNINEDYCEWDWTRGEGDFAYPFELNATVYRATDISNIVDTLRINNIDYGHPNKFEGAMATKKTDFSYKPIMRSYNEPSAVTLTINRVQDFYQNDIYEETSPETLLQLFNENKKIDLDFYKDKKYNSIHIGEFKII